MGKPDGGEVLGFEKHTVYRPLLLLSVAQGKRLILFLMLWTRWFFFQVQWEALSLSRQSQKVQSLSEFPEMPNAILPWWGMRAKFSQIWEKRKSWKTFTLIMKIDEKASQNL
ncbi:MAG: hypothetical protein F6K47_32230 [Symploca sp. SIO2E6]|nr:hypothetical protein [Symploca sp. SIO2E6]